MVVQTNTCYFVVVKLPEASGVGWMAEHQKEFEHLKVLVGNSETLAVLDGGVWTSAEVMQMMWEDSPCKAVAGLVEVDLDGTD